MAKMTDIIPRKVTHGGNERWRVIIPKDMRDNKQTVGRERFFVSQQDALGFAQELKSKRAYGRIELPPPPAAPPKHYYRLLDPNQIFKNYRTQNGNPRLLNLREVSEIQGVSVRTVAKWIKKRELQAVCINKRVIRVNPVALANFNHRKTHY